MPPCFTNQETLLVQTKYTTLHPPTLSQTTTQNRPKPRYWHLGSVGPTGHHLPIHFKAQQPSSQDQRRMVTQGPVIGVQPMPRALGLPGTQNLNSTSRQHASERMTFRESDPWESASNVTASGSSTARQTAAFSYDEGSSIESGSSKSLKQGIVGMLGRVKQWPRTLRSSGASSPGAARMNASGTDRCRICVPYVFFGCMVMLVVMLFCVMGFGIYDIYLGMMRERAKQACLHMSTLDEKCRLLLTKHDK